VIEALKGKVQSWANSCVFSWLRRRGLYLRSRVFLYVIITSLWSFFCTSLSEKNCGVPKLDYW
jgi:hypothetical protein